MFIFFLICHILVRSFIIRGYRHTILVLPVISKRNALYQPSVDRISLRWSQRLIWMILGRYGTLRRVMVGNIKIGWR